MYHDTTEIYDQDVPTPIFEIFPNPTKGVFKLQFHNLNLHAVSVELFDGYGTLLKRECLNDIDMQIDLSEYSAGIYYLKIFNRGIEIAVRKIVKAN